MATSVLSQKRKRDIAFAVFLGSSVVFGIADLVFYRSESWISTSFVLNTIAGTMAIASWCRYDSHVQNYPLSGRLWLVIWLIALVGVPVYLVQSRGWRRAARIGFGLPVFLLSIGLYYIGWYCSYWIADKGGYFQS